MNQDLELQISRRTLEEAKLVNDILKLTLGPMKERGEAPEPPEAWGIALRTTEELTALRGGRVTSTERLERTPEQVKTAVLALLEELHRGVPPDQDVDVTGPLSDLLLGTENVRDVRVELAGTATKIQGVIELPAPAAESRLERPVQTGALFVALDLEAPALRLRVTAATEDELRCAVEGATRQALGACLVLGLAAPRRVPHRAPLAARDERAATQAFDIECLPGLRSATGNAAATTRSTLSPELKAACAHLSFEWGSSDCDIGDDLACRARRLGRALGGPSGAQWRLRAAAEQSFRAFTAPDSTESLCWCFLAMETLLDEDDDGDEEDEEDASCVMTISPLHEAVAQRLGRTAGERQQLRRQVEDIARVGITGTAGTAETDAAQHRAALALLSRLYRHVCAEVSD